MKNKRFSLRAIFITVFITFLLTGGLGILAARCLLGPGRLALLEGMTLIERRFVGEYDTDEVVDAALTGMVDALDDRWSVYMDPAWHALSEQAMKNAYVGIGITYQRAENPFGMEIVEVAAGGPAEEAGLTVGEIITGVNGETLTEENLSDVVGQISSLEGKDLTLTVRGTDGKAREVTLDVRQVENSPVEYELIDNGEYADKGYELMDHKVGYVRLENFFQHSATYTQEAVADLIDQGAEGLLFDVRGNPGGYVNELTQLLDYLLPEGPIFGERGKNGGEHTVQSDAACVDLPMVVLVDGDSYSAAELFAAQLRESIGAKLVGQKTYGKGYYQQGFTLANGGELHISTGMYTTGNGVSLIGTGLTPDHVVTGVEEQLETGVKVLLDEMEAR